MKMRDLKKIYFLEFGIPKIWLFYPFFPLNSAIFIFNDFIVADNSYTGKATNTWIILISEKEHILCHQNLKFFMSSK